MEDIKVGEYVRTKDGMIAKVIDNSCHFVTDILYRNQKGYCGRHDSEIRDYRLYINNEQAKECKHSPNIIDLVEKDDYVNGYKVLYDYKETDKEQCNGEYRKCIIVETKSGQWKMVDWDIKSIVTKEQFESIKYIVGGKEK